MVDPKGKPESKKARDSAVGEPMIAPAEVAFYLERHPDFLVEHPNLLAILTPPNHRRGNNIVDMQHFMVERLRTDLHRLKSQQRALIATSRSNLSSQQRVHASVLALLSAASFEQLIQTVTTDLAVLLDIDVVTLCVESVSGFARTTLPGLQLLEPGDVDALLGPTRDALLEDEVAGDPAIFGSGAGLVQSEALLRLRVAKAPPGLLALGTRRAGKFKAGQGTELLCFLAQALGVTIGQWLDL
jgi:uncharacterized protein YigA (DUF484 family)